jgi:hypothetical protein
MATLSLFVPSIAFLYISFGVGGIRWGCIVFVPLVCLNEYCLDMAEEA